MRIIYPNGIIIECTRDEYLESIKDDQVNANREVITAINDFKSALLSKIDSLKDVSNASFLLFQKFSEEFRNFLSQKTSVSGVDDLEELNNFFKNLKQGNFEYKPAPSELLCIKPSETTASTNPPSEQQTVTPTNDTDNQQIPEDMLEQIIYVYRSSDTPFDFDNPIETYKNPKKAADAHNISIQEFMKCLDTETIYNGFVFMTKKRALQKSKTRKKHKTCKVYVYDENWDNKRVFDSMTQASRMLAVAILTIRNNIDKGKLVKHKYYFTSEPIECKISGAEPSGYLVTKTDEEDIPEIEKTMREIHENDKKPYQVSRPNQMIHYKSFKENCLNPNINFGLAL